MVLGILDRLEEPILSDDHTKQTDGEISLKFHQDDDDDEEIINWRKKNKHNKILDDDDEEEVPTQDQNSNNSEIKENLNQIKLAESKGESNVMRNKIFEEEEDEGVLQQNYEKSDIKENVNPIEIVESKGENVKSSFSSFLANTDLFDAEDDSDEDRKVEDFSDECPTTEEREENVFHDEFVSSKKSKHQMSKKVPSRQRIKKDDVQQIHSETQRLIRESGVHLPYHKPKTMTLQEFLNRKKTVTEELKGVKGTLARIPPIHKKCQNNVLLTIVSNDISASQTKNNKIKKVTPLLDSESLGEKTNNVNKCQIDSNLLSQEPEVETTSEDLPDIHIPVLSQPDSLSQNLTDCDMSSPVIAYPLKSGLTPKLAALNLKLEAVKTFTPKLSGHPDSIIELGENTPKTIQPGVKELIQRFMKHTKKITPHGKRDVNISIIQKEKDETGKVELKEHNVNVSIGKDLEDDTLMNTPGAKFQNLKLQLRMEMKFKREQEYKKRLDAYEVDNEEGFNDEEEEEEELTETENETDEEEEEDVNLKDKPKRKKLEFVDEEAEEDELDNGEEEEEEDYEDEAQIDSREKKSENNNGNISNADLKLTLTSDSEESFEELDPSTKMYNVVNSTIERIPTVELFEASSQASKSSEKKLPESGIIKNCGSLSLDSSFELIGSEIPAHQPGGGLRFGRHSVNSQASQSDSEGPDFLSPDSKFVHTNRKKFPDWDDGQSLSSHLRSNLQGQSQDFNFTLRGTESATSSINGLKSHLEGDEDNMSELLGLCSGTFSEDGSSPFVNNNTQPNTQDNMNDLLQLCSGKFPDGVSTFENNNTQQNSQDNMNDLLQLCSGKFSDRSTPVLNSAQQSIQENRNDLLQLSSANFSEKSESVPFLFNETNSQSNETELLGLLSGEFPSGKKKSKPIPIDSDSDDSFQMLENSKLKRNDNLENCDIDDDDDNQDFTDNENDDKESDQEDDSNSLLERGKELHEEEAEFFSSLAPNKKKKFYKDFFEDEAELSGSENDVSSDENDDEADGDDAELLRLDMENDEELPSDEELRNQVGRVHLKTMIDEDKRNLRLYQEMFLRDGDLWSDGQGRQRRFRWKTVDDDSQLDLFQGNQSDECNEEDDPTDAQWRLQRHEREVWLQQENKKPIPSDDEKDDKIPSQGQKIDHNQVNGEKTSVEIKKGPWNCMSISNTSRCIGSFLKRSGDTLTEIAEMTKTVTNPNGPTHSRNFVFSTISVDEKKKPTKANPSNSSNLIEVASNRNKRMRMESNSLSSIFNFL